MSMAGSARMGGRDCRVWLGQVVWAVMAERWAAVANGMSSLQACMHGWWAGLHGWMPLMLPLPLPMR